MGSDIYTESAVAIPFSDFLDRKELNKKSVINAIVDDLIKASIIPATNHMGFRKDKYYLAEGLVDLISMDEGYEDDRERNTKILKIFCEHVSIDLDNLPECNFRSFENSRESGWDVETDVVYLMFESSGLFETKMTAEGKKLAKVLGQKSIIETTWTVHSY